MNDGAFLTLGENERAGYARPTGRLDGMLRCFVEFDKFAWSKVRETIDCPVYIRRVPNASPGEHVEMQQILQARQEAQEARASQRRMQVWNLVILGIVVAISAGALTVSIISLIVN